jgi:hypothetical protein
MANITRGGFRPKFAGIKGARRYEVVSGVSTAIFPGDVVTLLTDGTVAAASAGGADLVLGVVAAASYVDSSGSRVRRYIPASTTYSPTARGSKNASYVWVWDDPTIEYVATVSTGTNTAAVIYALLGANADIVATAGDTVYGRSNHTIDGSGATTGTLRFRITEIYRDPANDLTSANWKAVCQIDEGQHPFYSQAGI